MENDMDKFFLLTYTCTGYDGFLHSYHAWFRTEKELRAFVDKETGRGRKTEIELAIEILDCRQIEL